MICFSVICCFIKLLGLLFFVLNFVINGVYMVVVNVILDFGGLYVIFAVGVVIGIFLFKFIIFFKLGIYKFGYLILLWIGFLKLV